MEDRGDHIIRGRGVGTDSGEGQLRGGRSGRARSEGERGGEQGKGKGEEERGRREGGETVLHLSAI